MDYHKAYYNGLAIYGYRIPVVVGRCTLKTQKFGSPDFPTLWGEA